MTYLELSAWFVGAAVVAAIVLSVVSGRHRAHLGAVAVTVVVLFILCLLYTSPSPRDS